MGIVNVTPDSFSDGGRYNSVDAALNHAHALLADGAHIIDVGGESTRPGARILTSDEEWKRIKDVVRILAEDDICVSVDTYHSETARLAAESGAHIINDVTGGKGDSQMFDAVASTDVMYVLQHGRGNPQTMDSLAHYDNVEREVIDELMASFDHAEHAGVDAHRIILDPGYGFAKNPEHNWRLLANIDELVALPMPVLIGVSRKRFLSDYSVGSDVDGRDLPTAVISAYCASRGVWGVRVHNVGATVSALSVAAAIENNR
ncbi:MAG: dihydropteroate synthase [Actinomycetaceae bacterium]|nr:dihydropteroate synthase [Actinomycetaceae bacterium]